MIRVSLLSLALALAAEGCVQAKGSEHIAAAGRGPGGGERSDEAVAALIQAGDKGEAARESGLVDLPRFPSISPQPADRGEAARIVFSWRGDLWKVAVTGGHAERLTGHPGDDLHSAWSPDGKRIAFDSDRTGHRNIFIMNADGTDLRQVTDVDRACALTGFGVDPDGNEVVTFSARLEGDSYRAPRPYMCSTAGGDILRVNNAFGDNPKVSPDGRRVLLTRGGSRWSRRHYRGPDGRDVWLYDRSADSFTRLTHWEGNDGKACWAGPDRLLFISDRELNCGNVYRMDADKGGAKAKRLTSFTEDDVGDLDVSADGSMAVFTVWDKLYTLALDQRDAEPVPLTVTANQDEADNFQIKSIDKEVSEAALSPDGKVMAFIAYGEVYVRNVEEKSPTRRVTDSHARERHIAWSPNGLKVYFVSDRSGTDSIYAATVAMTREEVKEEFEKATKPAEEEEEEPEEEAEESKDEPQEKEAETPKEDEDDSEKEGDNEDDEEDDEEDESDQKDKDKDKDKKKKKKKEKLPKELRAKRWRDALTFNIEPVVVGEHNDRNPSLSGEGLDDGTDKFLAFRRSRGDLMILDLDSGEIRKLVSGWDPGLNWRWSPDGRYIAYQQNDLNFNSDIWVVPADGSKPAVNVTRHPDNDYDPRWSADGKILSFVSERVNEEFDVWMVYLDKDLEVFTPKELEDYYKDAVKAAKKRKPRKLKKPKEEGKEEGAAEDEDEEAETEGDDESEDSDKEKAEEGEEEEDDEEDEEEDEEEEKEEEPKELDLHDAYLRLRRVTTLGGSEGNIEITPGGDRYIFTATIGKSGLYSVKWDGEDRKRLCDSASVQHVSLTGDKIVLVTGGRAGTIGPEGKKIEYVEISDKIRIDLQEQASQKFLEMARILGENFYHPTLKGLNWSALTEKYHALARQTRTAGEFNHVGMRLFGELNGSHLGVYSRGSPPPNAQSQGRLGTVHKPVEGGYEVVEVVPESPASIGQMALKVGDVITAVELEPFGPTDTVESRLTGRGGKETIVTIKRTMDDGQAKKLNVLITPISGGALDRLKYRAWRRRNAERANEWSRGRIGYIHVRGMNQSSLDVFERDLFAAAGGKDGLIIDVRNNGGGWTADRLLASIMVRQHAYTIPRGADPEKIGHYPQDRLFIQRYTLPTNMLCNEKSFSNAEIVSHAFKTLKRGKLVGQQTYGGVISTGGMRLIDGTWVRLPFRGWYVVGGTDMENHGAVPDIIVPQTPEAESRDEDEQLRAAVDDLMKRTR